MYGPSIAIKTFDHSIECCCPGGEHAHTFTINKGNVIIVTNERRMSMKNELYYLVKINEQSIFYMALKDLEQYFMNNQLLSMVDIDLQLNYINYKINHALDTADEMLFRDYTMKLNEVSELKENMIEYLNTITV